MKFPKGRALTGHSHDYKRNGTSTLFAAFEVATGKVTSAHKTRRRRVEFLYFMNDMVAHHPNTAIHVVLNNLNTHKPKNDRWIKRHPRSPASGAAKASLQDPYRFASCQGRRLPNQISNMTRGNFENASAPVSVTRNVSLMT